MEPGPRAAGQGPSVTLAVVRNSPWNPILWRAGWAAACIGAASRGRGVNTQTHSRHGVTGRELGGCWSGSVLNSFSLKSFLGLQFSFFLRLPLFFFFLALLSFFKKATRMSGWTVVSGNGGASRFLCFFLWSLQAAEGWGWGGQEAPCKHLDLDWVRGWCWVKLGVPGWRSGCPSRHRFWETQYVFPSPDTEQDNS